MRQLITYRRLHPTTTTGDSIKVTTVFSSFDTEEINKLENYLKDYIGSGLTSVVFLEDNNDNC